MPNRVLMLRRN